MTPAAGHLGTTGLDRPLSREREDGWDEGTVRGWTRLARTERCVSEAGGEDLGGGGHRPTVAANRRAEWVGPINLSEFRGRMWLPSQ